MNVGVSMNKKLIWIIPTLIGSVIGLLIGNFIQSTEIGELQSRLHNCEAVILELENENYSLDEFHNQVYYDIPLSYELQEYTFMQCLKYDVDPVLALAVMKTESNFNPDTVSETNDYGIMQINECNHKWLSDAFGDIDFLDAKDNIKCGVYMLSRIKQVTIPFKLMVYNMGSVQAKALWEKEIYSTKYTDKVEKNMKYIERREVML